MDVTEYGCNENTNIKEDDSAVSEKCWQENRRGDSRKWLIRDGSNKNLNSDLQSTMKASYTYPFQDERVCIGM